MKENQFGNLIRNINEVTERTTPIQDIQDQNRAVRSNALESSGNANYRSSTVRNNASGGAKEIFMETTGSGLSDLKMLFLTAAFCVRTKKFDKAIVLFSDLLKRLPAHAEAKEGRSSSYLYLTVCYLETKRFSEAVHSMVNALNMNQTCEPAAFYFLEQSLERQLHINEAESDLLCLSGLLTLIKGDEEKAVQIIKEAIFLESNSANPWFCLGMVLTNEHDGGSIFKTHTAFRTKIAIQAFESAVRLKDDWMEAHFRLGVLCLKLADFNSMHQALQAFMKVVSLGRKQNIENNFVRDSIMFLENHELLKLVSKGNSVSY